MGDPAKTQGSPSTIESTTLAGASAQTRMDPPGLNPQAVHNYGPGFDAQHRTKFEEFLAAAYESTQTRLANQALGENSNRPWFAAREGESVFLTVPLTINRGDQLAELLAVLASEIPTVTLCRGTVGWVEPTWSATASRMLVGVASALQGAPGSFSSTSSPVDLTRSAIWIEACSIAASAPGVSQQVRSTVIPSSITGDKSAKKYLSNVQATLRSSAPGEEHQDAITSLALLIKMWSKNQSKAALALIANQKISWSEVLHKGAPTTNKRVRGKTVRSILTPLKPSRSPWVAQGEGQYLSKLYAGLWSAPESIRQEWIALKASEQHSQFSVYVNRVRLAYAEMNAVSQGVNARLGHRKKWIMKTCDEAGLKINKREAKDPFKWSLAFYKQDLSLLNESVKKVFNPAHYLESKYDADIILTEVLGEAKKSEINWTGIRMGREPLVISLFSSWIDRFKPALNTLSSVPDAATLGDQNIFSILQVEESTSA
jgi:hypothetical protein